MAQKMIRNCLGLIDDVMCIEKECIATGATGGFKSNGIWKWLDWFCMALIIPLFLQNFRFWLQAQADSSRTLFSLSCA